MKKYLINTLGISILLLLSGCGGSGSENISQTPNIEQQPDELTNIMKKIHIYSVKEEVYGKYKGYQKEIYETHYPKDKEKYLDSIRAIRSKKCTDKGGVSEITFIEENSYFTHKEYCYIAPSQHSNIIDEIEITNDLETVTQFMSSIHLSSKNEEIIGVYKGYDKESYETNYPKNVETYLDSIRAIRSKKCTDKSGISEITFIEEHSFFTHKEFCYIKK